MSFLLILGLAGCNSGSGSQEAPRVLTEVTVVPSSVSLNRGQAIQVIPRALDQEEDAMLADFTFNTSNSAIFTVSNSGLICAGTWDSLTTPVVCTPAAAPGTANLTVTATAGGVSVTSDPVPVFVHDVVDSIVVAPVAVDLANCLSQDNDTGPDINLQFTAQAFAGGVDVTSTVGPFTWSSSFPTVATISTAGLATGELPGVSSITASVGSVNAVISPGTPLTICPPASLSLHVNGSTATSFSVAVNGTQTLAIDVVDTKGEPLESVSVTYQVVNPNIAAINTSTRVVTGSAVGATGIIAHCTPPACNTGSIIPTYSNVVMATVTGTPAAGRAYATCSSASAPCTTAATGGGTQTPLVPIDTSTDTAGTVVNLPQTPNSMVFTRDGGVLFLGSANGMMIVDPVANTFSGTVNNMPGRVLAVSPDGNRVVVSNIPGATVFILDRAANSIQVLGISDATAAAFTPDGLKLFIVANNTLFVASPVFALQNILLADVANDVTVLPGGSFAFLAGGEASSITVRATCDNSPVLPSLGTTAAPPLIASLPDGSGVVAANSPSLDVITVTPTFSGCPPSHGGVLTPVDFGQGAFTPRQIIVLPDATRVYVTSDLTSLLAYDVAGGTTSAIALTGGAQPTTGGATVSGNRLYLGGSNNAVHRIDVGTATDATSINLTFTPDLVGVRPR
ncbi:MAG: hypothetical protein ACRD2Q_02750 [Terriglobales bacterium]